MKPVLHPEKGGVGGECGKYIDCVKFILFGEAGKR